jgi:type IV pilus assembly protein PilB
VSAEASTTSPPPPRGVVPPSEPGGRSGFLSDVIVELGFATEDAVEAAVREARSGTTVAQVLVESGTITEEQLARATAERYGLAYIDLDDFEVDRGAAALIRPSAAKRYKAVPVGFVGGGLLVAMTDPADSLAVSDIAVMP